MRIHGGGGRASECRDGHAAPAGTRGCVRRLGAAASRAEKTEEMSEGDRGRSSTCTVTTTCGIEKGRESAGCPRLCLCRGRRAAVHARRSTLARPSGGLGSQKPLLEFIRGGAGEQSSLWGQIKAVRPAHRRAPCRRHPVALPVRHIQRRAQPRHQQTRQKLQALRSCKLCFDQKTWYLRCCSLGRSSPQQL